MVKFLTFHQKNRQRFISRKPNRRHQLMADASYANHLRYFNYSIETAQGSELLEC